MIRTVLCLLASSSLVLGASVVQRDQAPTDAQILNYALTLEHLENAFYKEGLSRFDAGAFQRAGMEKWVYGRFSQIAEHEAAHVMFLEKALGDQAVKACEYKFPFDDPQSFVGLSMILEGVGVSAYLGAAKYISNKDYLTAAGSILTTESRHAAWVSSAVKKQAAWSGALDVPLGLNQVYSLAAPFFVSCPASNPALPVKAFPTLTVETPQYTGGSTIRLGFDDSSVKGQQLHLALFTGLSTEYAEIHDKLVKLPEGLQGTVYGVITKGQDVTDDNTVAGPVILYFPIHS